MKHKMRHPRVTLASAPWVSYQKNNQQQDDS